MDKVSKAPRPSVLHGVTVKVVTACGNMYVQMNWNQEELFEVFATLGRSGGCATAESEALTRCITIGLRCGIPVEEYIEQLCGIRCPSPMNFPEEQRVLSCPDALGRCFKNYGSLSYSEVLKKVAEC